MSSLDQREPASDAAESLALLGGLDLGNEVVRALLEQVPDGLVVVDGAGRIRFVNRGMEEIFGFARADLLGQVVEVLVPEPLHDAHRAHRTQFREAPHRRPMGNGIELEGRRSDGSTFPLEISLSPLTSGADILTIAAVRDVSDRKETEREVRSVQQTLQETRQRLALSEDRERIARDLHDKVIQRLFATGLGLQAAASRTEADTVRDRLRAAIDDLDLAIRDIRTSIFELHEPGDSAGAGLRSAVIAKVNDAGRILGCSPSVRFAGPVDTVSSESINEALLATLQEALSNVVRHARASAVDIEVRVDDAIELVVCDDGIGMTGTPKLGDGLRNMRARVDELGGSLVIERAHPSGTRVIWRAPRPDADA